MHEHPASSGCGECFRVTAISGNSSCPFPGKFGAETGMNNATLFKKPSHKVNRAVYTYKV